MTSYTSEKIPRTVQIEDKTAAEQLRLIAQLNEKR
jgi:hypothetical protein